MNNTARIQIEVLTFIPNATVPPSGARPTGDLCVIAPRPTLVNGSANRDVQDDDWKVRIADDGTIVVHRKKNGAAPIKLEFVLTGPGAPLIPTQILFFADSPDAASADPRGENNFKDREVTGGVISIRNHWQAHGRRRPGSAGRNDPVPRWKYYIRVKQGEAAGWIDPGIENAEDMVG